MSEKKEIRKLSPETVEHLRSMLDEFLTCYLLVGFDMDGDRVFCNLFHTQMQADALQQLMEDTLERYRVPRVVKVLEDDNDGRKGLQGPKV